MSPQDSSADEDEEVLTGEGSVMADFGAGTAAIVGEAGWEEEDDEPMDVSSSPVGPSVVLSLVQQVLLVLAASFYSCMH